MSQSGSSIIGRFVSLAALAVALAACSTGAPSPSAFSVAGATATPGASASAPSTAASPSASAELPVSITHAQLVSMFSYDAAAPLNVKDVTPAKTADGVTVRDITYDTAGGKPVVAWLVTPAGTGPFAAVLWFPYLAAVGGDRSEFLDEAKALAKRGVVSLLPDRDFPGIVNPTDWQTDRQSIVDQVTVLRRGIDVLLAQPGVDSKRIGFVGHEFAAMDGAVLATVDHRLAAAVFMTPDANWRHWFFEFFAFSPSDEPEYTEAMKQFDFDTLLPQLAPTKVFLQFGDPDGFIPPETVAQINAASNGAKSVTYPNTTHDLQQFAAATADRDAWLSDQLGLAK